MKVIASIEEPELIERILAHRRERGEGEPPTAGLGARGAAAAPAVLIRLMVEGLAFSGGRRTVLCAVRPKARVAG